MEFSRLGFFQDPYRRYLCYNEKSTPHFGLLEYSFSLQFSSFLMIMLENIN